MSAYATCCACGAPIHSLERTWVRNQSNAGDRRIWFVCERCLDGGVAFEWSSRGPKVRA